jgi:hypothetical protein
MSKVRVLPQRNMLDAIPSAPPARPRIKMPAGRQRRHCFAFCASRAPHQAAGPSPPEAYEAIPDGQERLVSAEKKPFPVDHKTFARQEVVA